MSDPSAIIKVAKNEWLLAVFRGTTSIFLAVITAYVVGTRDEVKAINRDLADFKIAYAERIAKVEGQVGELKGSIDVHRSRLTGLDADTRAIWGRLYEMGTRQSTPKATP